ncbi:PIN-like domain-containing protein [Amycolatopsis sp. CA-126428]|uniref:PIN-like domain-containing protein n=1 Tax=Amycolatopsis sp. CA-126428 TaxID=2073158 RepID=UPI0011B00D2A|nr:PIN-like domain-containing protein [Amycolatopsis sp. CA-126428]
MGSESRSSGGLFEGFEAYQTPTNDEYQKLFDSGLIVIDANVLLDLYRYNHDTRQDLLRVLDRLKHQIWLPHQVALEFWRGREGALSDPDARAEGVVSQLQSTCDSVPKIISTWANRVSLSTAERERIVDKISSGFRLAIAEIHEISNRAKLIEHEDSTKDSILSDLRELLAGRVGPPLAANDHADALKEASRRIDNDIPPGYLDRKKGDTEAVAGDYLLWRQTLVEASNRNSDVLLITRDTKDDWWRNRSGRARGPRPELVAEMKSEAGVRLFMMRTDSLLYHAKNILNVEVRSSSVENVEAIAQIESLKAATQRNSELLSSELDHEIDRLASKLNNRTPLEDFRYYLQGRGFRIHPKRSNSRFTQGDGMFFASRPANIALLGVISYSLESLSASTLKRLSAEFSLAVELAYDNEFTAKYLVIALEREPTRDFTLLAEENFPDVRIVWRLIDQWGGSHKSVALGIVPRTD